MSPSKYHSIKTVVDNITFASKREAERYYQLKLLARARVIADLRLQPEFQFLIAGKKIFSYFADFSYIDLKRRGGAERRIVIEDVKSPATQKLSTYRLKKKLIEAQYQITITEV